VRMRVYPTHMRVYPTHTPKYCWTKNRACHPILQMRGLQQCDIANVINFYSTCFANVSTYRIV